MANPYLDELDEICVDKTSLNLKQMLRVIEVLDEIRVLIDDEHLYVQRCAGLARNTTKPNPLECPFVLKAISKMLDEHLGDFKKLGVCVAEVEGVLGELDEQS